MYYYVLLWTVKTVNKAGALRPTIMRNPRVAVSGSATVCGSASGSVHVAVQAAVVCMWQCSSLRQCYIVNRCSNSVQQ
jgi:hypothetical protein